MSSSAPHATPETGRAQPSYSVDDLLLVLHALGPPAHHGALNRSLRRVFKPWSQFADAFATVASFHTLCHAAAVSVTPDIEDAGEPIRSINVVVACDCTDDDAVVSKLKEDLTTVLTLLKPLALNPLSCKRPMDDAGRVAHFKARDGLIRWAYCFAGPKLTTLVERCQNIVVKLTEYLEEQSEGEGESEDEVEDDEDADGFDDGDVENEGERSDEDGDHDIERLCSWLTELISFSHAVVHFQSAIGIRVALREKTLHELLESIVPGSPRFLMDEATGLCHAICDLIGSVAYCVRRNQGLPEPVLTIVPVIPESKPRAELTQELIGTLLKNCAAISLPQHEFSEKGKERMVKFLRLLIAQKAEIVAAGCRVRGRGGDRAPIASSHCVAALVHHIIETRVLDSPEQYIGMSAPSCGACLRFLQAVKDVHGTNFQVGRWHTAFPSQWNSHPLSGELDDAFRKILEEELIGPWSELAEDWLAGDLVG